MNEVGIEVNSSIPIIYVEGKRAKYNCLSYVSGSLSLFSVY